jgi:hypothetical protein
LFIFPVTDCDPQSATVVKEISCPPVHTVQIAVCPDQTTPAVRQHGK